MSNKRKDNKFKLFERLKKLSAPFNEIDDLWNQWKLRDTFDTKDDEVDEDAKIKIEDWNTHKFHDKDNGKIFVCLCSHSPITVLNLMKNTKTKERCTIGSCCIKKFGTKNLKTEMKVKIGEKKGIRYCGLCRRKLPSNYEHWKKYHKKCYFQVKDESDDD